MPKTEKVCKICGKGKKAGKMWGGVHKACRLNLKAQAKQRKQPPAPAVASAAAPAPIQAGIMGPDGVRIPVHLDITVSIKVEARQ
jgi:hypothetical protein